MAKQEMVTFTKEQADKACAQIVAAIVAAFGAHKLTHEQALSVAKTLDFIEGRKGKSEIKAFPTVAGCRFGKVDEVTTGVAVQVQRRAVSELVSERDTLAGKLASIQALLAKLGGAESDAALRAQLSAEGTGIQEQLDAVKARLTRYATVLAEIDAESKAREGKRYNDAVARVATLEKLAKSKADRDAIAPMLDSERATMNDAAVKLRAMGVQVETQAQAA